MQYEEVKELIAIFEKTDLNDMEVQLDNVRLRLNRGPVSPWAASSAAVPVAAAQQAVPAAPVAALEQTDSVPAEDSKMKRADSAIKTDSAPKASAAESTKVIKAPIVGTFYQSAAPDEAPFVKTGDTVSEGDVVCIIEAMKFMNEVNSEVSGTITEILVKDGEFVEYGQELFRVK